MHLNQTPANVARKRASSADLSRWRDEWVDPELLARPVMERTVSLEPTEIPMNPIEAVQRSFGINYTEAYDSQSSRNV
jgi:hypothetical protein